MKVINIFWTIMVFNALLMLILAIQCFAYLDDIKNEVYLKTIELNDHNEIIENVKVLDLICDDNVYVSGYYFSKLNPFGDDYVYLSTWRDGNIPHSNGKCVLKIKEGMKK